MGFAGNSQTSLPGTCALTLAYSCALQPYSSLPGPFASMWGMQVAAELMATVHTRYVFQGLADFHFFGSRRQSISPLVAYGPHPVGVRPEPLMTAPAQFSRVDVPLDYGYKQLVIGTAGGPLLSVGRPIAAVGSGVPATCGVVAKDGQPCSRSWLLRSQSRETLPHLFAHLAQLRSSSTAKQASQVSLDLAPAACLAHSPDWLSIAAAATPQQAVLTLSSAAHPLEGCKTASPPDVPDASMSPTSAIAVLRVVCQGCHLSRRGQGEHWAPSLDNASHREEDTCPTRGTRA